MRIKQVSVFLENTAGRLAEVTQVLAKKNINIRAVSIADTADFGILRLIVDRSEEAARALTEAGFTTRLNDVLAVEIPDVPGSLARVMEIFRENNVNIEYLYASLEGKPGKAVVIFKVEDIDHGLNIVKQHGLSMVEGF